MSSAYPQRGTIPWDTALKGYIDSTQEELKDYGDAQLAEEAQSRLNQIATLGDVIADQGDTLAAHDTRLTTLETDGGGGSGEVANLRVILWDGSEYEYNHSEWWDDTSVPREFRGPVDPSTIGLITLGYLDVWRPSGSAP